MGGHAAATESHGPHCTEDHIHKFEYFSDRWSLYSDEQNYFIKGSCHISPPDLHTREGGGGVYMGRMIHRTSLELNFVYRIFQHGTSSVLFWPICRVMSWYFTNLWISPNAINLVSLHARSCPVPALFLPNKIIQSCDTPISVQGFRVKEGLGCVIFSAVSPRKSTHLGPSLTRKPCI